MRHMRRIRTFTRAVPALLVSGALTLAAASVQAQGLLRLNRLLVSVDAGYVGAIAWNHISLVNARLPASVESGLSAVVEAVLPSARAASAHAPGETFRTVMDVR